MSSSALFEAGVWVKTEVSPGLMQVGQVTHSTNNHVNIMMHEGFTVVRLKKDVRRVPLLVLDLNGVLVVREDLGRKITVRPGVNEFLAFALRNFAVGVWSSCTEENGHKIIKSTFGPVLEKFLVLKLFRNACTPAPTADKQHATIKELNKLWGEGSKFTQQNTIIVDDSAEKCSHPDNAIYPPAYDAARSNDETLRVLQKYLEEIASSENVLDAMRAKPCPFPRPVSPSVEAADAAANGRQTSPIPHDSAVLASSASNGGRSPSPPPVVGASPPGRTPSVGSSKKWTGNVTDLLGN